MPAHTSHTLPHRGAPTQTAGLPRRYLRVVANVDRACPCRRSSRRSPASPQHVPMPRRALPPYPSRTAPAANPSRCALESKSPHLITGVIKPDRFNLEGPVRSNLVSATNGCGTPISPGRNGLRNISAIDAHNLTDVPPGRQADASKSVLVCATPTAFLSVCRGFFEMSGFGLIRNVWSQGLVGSVFHGFQLMQC